MNLLYFPLKLQSSEESPNPPTKNSDFSPTAKVSSQREPIPYICGLRARIECEPFSEHSIRSDRVTNIGYRLSLGASLLPVANQEFSIHNTYQYLLLPLIHELSLENLFQNTSQAGNQI